MSDAHVHLLLTHVPVIGIVLGLLVLAFAWFARKTETAQVALGIFVLSALGGRRRVPHGRGGRRDY